MEEQSKLTREERLAERDKHADPDYEAFDRYCKRHADSLLVLQFQEPIARKAHCFAFADKRVLYGYGYVSVTARGGTSAHKNGRDPLSELSLARKLLHDALKRVEEDIAGQAEYQFQNVIGYPPDTAPVSDPPDNSG